MQILSLKRITDFLGHRFWYAGQELIADQAVEEAAVQTNFSKKKNKCFHLSGIE